MNRGPIRPSGSSSLLAGLLASLLGGCAGSEPPPPPPPPVWEGEPTGAEPIEPGAAAAEPTEPEPKEAEAPAAEPTEPGPTSAEAAEVVTTEPMEPTEPPAEPSEAAGSSSPASASTTLEATVPDVLELRQDLTFVKGVPSLSAPDDDAPASLLREGAGAGGACVFVRLRELWLGGELDAAGDEEIRVIVSQGDASATLLARTLDLGSDLAGFPFRDSPWVELADGEAPLELEVVEEDETEDEDMTSTLEPCQLPLPPGSEETLHEVPLDDIVATEVRLFGRSREVHLEGAKATLGLIRVARRQAPDPAALRSVGEAFAPLRGAPRGGDAAAALALARAAGRAGDQAMQLAARSTDSWLRREVPPLAAEARRVAIVAATVAQADLAAVQRAQGALARALGALSPDEAASLAATRSLTEPPVEQLELEALRASAARAEELEDEVQEALFGAESDALAEVASALHDLKEVLRRAARGLELTPALRDGRAALELRLNTLR